MTQVSLRDCVAAWHIVQTSWLHPPLLVSEALTQEALHLSSICLFGELYVRST